MKKIPFLHKDTKMKYIRGICITATSILITCTSFFTYTLVLSPKTHFIHLASTTPTLTKDKKIPEKYNGQVRKIAYITFDDGPSIYQEEILNILKQHNIRATFFLIGSNIPYHTDSLKRLVREGHYPGLHSMTHNYQKLYNEGQIVNEMKQVQEAIHSITGIQTNLTRCPYGSMPGLTLDLRNQLVEANLKEWDWTVDSLDWKLPNNPTRVIQNVLAQSTDNQEVILLHEKSQTVQALPAILDGLKNNGYDFEVYQEASHFPLNFWNDNRL